MSFLFDKEFEEVISKLIDEPVQEPQRGDWQVLRQNNTEFFKSLNIKPAGDVMYKEFEIISHDGEFIQARWYTKEGTNPGSAVVYSHGGGMVSGSIELYHPMLSQFVSKSGVPFLAIDYRKAPEHQGTSLVEDVYAGLLWLIEHSDELGIDKKRIAVMGDSAGGGIVAGVAIAARDRGIELEKQILIYPMLNDKNLETDGVMDPFLMWSYNNNYTGWKALLGDQFNTEEVSPLSAPSRNTDFEGLASAYIEVGELDIFRDEDVDYAKSLWNAGISTELHVYPGVPHAFELLASEINVSKCSLENRLRVLTSL